MEPRITTLHPHGKRGVNINGDKYHLVRFQIRLALEEFGDMTLSALTQAVQAHLEGRFDGSIPWYVIWVRLDLEARGEIVPVAGGPPRRYRLNGS